MPRISWGSMWWYMKPEMRGVIRTVTGDIPPEQLGACQCHEHIYISGDRLGPHTPVRPIDDFACSAAELRDYAAAGGCALVDAQPQSCGGAVEVLRRLSAETGVKIIASAGFHKLAFYRQDSAVMIDPEQALARRFAAEIRQGAGIIKTAVDRDGISGRYCLLHAAAAAAAAETGAAVLCHVEQGASLMELIAFYSFREIAPERLILCHADRAVPDRGAHLAALREGVYLEYDTICRPKYHDDAQEAALILYLLEKGYENQLLMGLDTTRERLTHYSRRDCLCSVGNFSGASAAGLSYIRRQFLPLLRRSGAAARQLDLIMTKNPACALQLRLPENGEQFPSEYGEQPRRAAGMLQSQPAAETE